MVIGIIVFGTQPHRVTCMFAERVHIGAVAITARLQDHIIDHIPHDILQVHTVVVDGAIDKKYTQGYCDCIADVSSNIYGSRKNSSSRRNTNVYSYFNNYNYHRHSGG